MLKDRRQFLRASTLALAALAIPHVAQARTVTTCKGFSCTNGSASAVNSLIGGTAPTLLKQSWGEHLFDGVTYAGDTRTAISLAFMEDDLPLNAANITAAVNSPRYSGYWILGSEESAYMTPQAFWNMVKPQRDAVYAVHPQAKFILEAGLINEFVEAAHWLAGSFFRQLWNLIPEDGKKGRFKGYHWNAYPSSSYTIPQMMVADKAFRDEDFPNMESWITEIGRPLTSGADKFNPTYVYQKAQQYGVHKVFWYRQTATGGSGDNYYMLQEDGVNTPYGEQFRAI